MQIVHLSIDLPVPQLLHPSLHQFPFFPDVIAHHHTVISSFLLTLPSIFSHLFTFLLLFNHIHLSKRSPQWVECVSVCLCVHGICARKDICLASGQRKRLSVLLLRDRQTTTNASEWVCMCICLHALSCLCTSMPASQWSRHCACLSIFFCLSVFLSGQFAVWGPP